MGSLSALFQNRVLITSLIAWGIAQLLKVIIVLISTRRLDISRFVGSGGMPSSHAAFVVSLSAAVGFEAGFDSTIYALSCVFAMVVMYDAAGVRRAVGKQARILNRIVAGLLEMGEPPQYELLKELLGHTPVEVFAGAILGALVAAWRM